MQITLPFPPSVNSLYATDWKTKRRFKSKRYAEWCDTALSALQAAWDCYKLEEYCSPVKITYIFGRPDKRKRDLSNLLKAVDDLLVSEGTLTDDSLIHEIHARWGTSPGVQITIEKL